MSNQGAARPVGKKPGARASRPQMAKWLTPFRYTADKMPLLPGHFTTKAQRHKKRTVGKMLALPGGVAEAALVLLQRAFTTHSSRLAPLSPPGRKFRSHKSLFGEMAVESNGAFYTMLPHAVETG